MGEQVNLANNPPLIGHRVHVQVDVNFHLCRSSFHIEMPKRKRKEGTNPAVGTVQGTETAKRKPRHDSGPRNDPSKTPSSIQDGGKVVQPAVKPSQPNAVRIIVGSYEKVLCGIDVRFDMQHPEKVILSRRKSDIVAHSKFESRLHVLRPFWGNQMSCRQRPLSRFWRIRRGDKVPTMHETFLHRIYDLKKRKDLGSLVQHNGAITALQFYSRTHLLSASEDGTICIWRTRDWECMATMKGHKGRVNGMCVHPSGKIAVSVGKDKALRLWNLMTGRKASANRLGEEAFDVKWDDAGDQYAILFDRKIVIYDMSALPKVTIEHHVRIHCIRYFQHPVHGETLMSGTDDKLIRIHSLADGAVLQELKGHRAR